MTRVYTDGCEFGDLSNDFWETISKPTSRRLPTPWSMLFINQDEITINIKRGNVHIEGDYNHYLFYNRLMEKEFVVEFLVRCEYCRRFSYASDLCEHCGALLL